MPTPHTAKKVEQYFNVIAPQYDDLKAKNAYYFSEVLRLIRNEVPARSSILEVGCGTGNLISALQPSTGVGLDISPRMIAIAKHKNMNKTISFITSTPERYSTDQSFAYIVSADVIEHVPDLEPFFSALNRLAQKDTRIIITYANPLWEPILLLLEKLKLKMPEGPHYRPAFRELQRIIKKNGLKLARRKFQTILPLRIPFLAPLLNWIWGYLPLLRRLCLLEMLLLKKDEHGK